jgi:hypothetical protein
LRPMWPAIQTQLPLCGHNRLVLCRRAVEVDR